MKFKDRGHYKLGYLALGRSLNLFVVIKTKMVEYLKIRFIR